MDEICTEKQLSLRSKNTVYSGTMLKTALFSTEINRKITLYVKLNELNLNQLN